MLSQIKQKSLNGAQNVAVTLVEVRSHVGAGSERVAFSGHADDGRKGLGCIDHGSIVPSRPAARTRLPATPAVFVGGFACGPAFSAQPL